jgi:phospholipase C
MKRSTSALFSLLLAVSCNRDPEPCQSRNSGSVAPTPQDPPVSCSPASIPERFQQERAACTFRQGASATTTLGVDRATALTIPIRHVIIIMKENRTFDHVLGKLHEQGQPATLPVPAGFGNVDDAGAFVSPFRATTTCIPHDPPHQWDDMHASVNGGQMDGFVSAAARSTGTDGHFTMSYYTQADLPFYYWLAGTWALNDNHFASLRTGTNPNRYFLMFGTNAGVRSTDEGMPAASTPSLFGLLEHAGYTWGSYGSGSPLSGALGWNHDSPHCYCLRDLLDQLDSGTLPNVVFVDGRESIQDDHPDADLQTGEAWLQRIYLHAINSPQWPRMALFWTYDEGGGFADHVPPPNAACAPGLSPGDDAFVELGPRVPFVLISPYAKPHYVSHTVQDHTAMTRFIETVFDLPALSARDANSTALLDMFDFSCAPPMLLPPRPPAPGTGGCLRVSKMNTDIGSGM